MNDNDLSGAVLAEATIRYEEGGWDVLVECWSTPDFTDHWDRMAEAGETRPVTVAQAIKSVEDVVAVWADRQADARNSAF